MRIIVRVVELINFFNRVNRAIDYFNHVLSHFEHTFNAYPVCVEGKRNHMTEGHLAAEHWPRNLLTIKLSKIKSNAEPEIHGVNLAYVK